MSRPGIKRRQVNRDPIIPSRRRRAISLPARPRLHRLQPSHNSRNNHNSRNDPAKAKTRTDRVPPRFRFCNPAAAGNIGVWASRVGNLKEMRQRVGGVSTRAAVPVFELALRPAANSHGVILGVDPSLRGTGYGIIRVGNPLRSRSRTGRFPARKTGNARAASPKFPRRCATFCANTSRRFVWSKDFFAQNLKTAIIMGEARGAAMATIAEAGLDIYEIATRKVKLAIVGYGAAQNLPSPRWCSGC